MKNFFKYILTFLLSGLFYSCEDQYTICELSKNVNLRGVFFTKSGNDFIEKKVNSLTIHILDSPDFIYKDQKDLSTFIFGLKPFFNTGSEKYVIKTDNLSQADTLTIEYTSANVELTKECGSIITHTLSKVTCTNNTIDSVKIISSKIDNNINVNLRLFL